MAIIRLVDNLGRVVLPNELMPKVGLEKGDEVTIEVYDNSFLISPVKPHCCICGKKNPSDRLLRLGEKYICIECRDEMKNL